MPLTTCDDDAVTAPEDRSSDGGSADDSTPEPGTGAGSSADPAPARRRRWPRGWKGRVLLAAAVVVVLGVVVVGGALAWVRLSAGPHEHTVADAPAADVGLVLGAGLRPDGTPSQYLQYRLDDALALYRAGKVKVLLVSGDNRTTTYDEPSSMRDYLVAHGVPAGKVVRDFAGQDTYDSCVRAARIFGVHRVLVITQQYHLARAVFLCRQVGLDADGAADPHPLVSSGPELREVPAAVKAAWDAVWQPDPRHLGPPETAVTTALAGG